MILTARNRSGWGQPNRFEPLSGSSSQSESDGDWLSLSSSAPVKEPKVRDWGKAVRPLSETNHPLDSFGLPIWGRNCTSHRFLKEKGRGKASDTLKRRDAEFIIWPERPFVEFAHSCRRLENVAYTLAEGAIALPFSERRLVRNTLKALLYGYDCRLGYLRYPAGRSLMLPRSLKGRVFQALRLLSSYRQAVNSLEAGGKLGRFGSEHQLSRPKASPDLVRD